jgi:hypothetical protein
MFVAPLSPHGRCCSAFLAASACLVLGSCEPNLEARYPYDLRVTSDPGQPVTGARIVQRGVVVGTTGDDGRVRLTALGVEGSSVDLSVLCPDGYRSPAAPLTIVLRRLMAGTPVPEYGASCPPSERRVVVVVRARDAADVPVVYLGREMARTDASGAAHVLLTAAPNARVTIELRTNGVAGGRLRPQNPSLVFVVPDRDEIVAFDQRFALEPVARRPRPAVHEETPDPGPIRL